MRTISIAAGLALMGGAAFAQDGAPSGDPAAGEAVFRQCATCHVVTDPEGNTLAGRNGRVGPNLYGLAGRTAGSVDGFRYSGSMTEAGEAGLQWNEEDFVSYVQDPSGFLKEYLDDSSARGQMVFQVRDPQDAADVYAYITSLGGSESGGGEATN